jgi:hypothetical protein
MEAKWDAQPVTVATADAEAIKQLTANKNDTDFRLFNVWSTTCGPCILEFPDLVDIYRQYSWQEFEFFPISLDPPADAEKVTKFLARQESGLSPRAQTVVENEGRSTNNLIFDGDTEELVQALDPEWNGAMPHTLLVGEGGKILFRHTGKIDPVALKKAIVAEVWKDKK